MESFIYFTNEQKHSANSVNLAELLRRRGEKLLPSGRDKRLSSDHSITIRGNQWFDHATGEGGLAVDFVRRLYNMSFPEAVTFLLDGEQGETYHTAEEKPAEQPKLFTVPQANERMRRVYAYLLQHRGIDREIVNSFVQAGLLYEDAEYHNAVFIGKDEHGVIRHAHKRSVNSEGKVFRQNVEGSDPRHSFHWTGTTEQLYVFEAPIDMLSYITLYPENWQTNSFVALCGTSEHAMLWMLQQNGSIQTVSLCLDNDEAGAYATERLSNILRERGYTDIHAMLPALKDWNDVLRTKANALEMAGHTEQPGMAQLI
jgi:hypothetical protein